MTRRAQKDEYQTFVFAVEKTDPSYTLGLATSRLDRGLYSEHLHLGLQGRCVHPARHKGAAGRLVLLGDRERFAQPERAGWKPELLGLLTIRKGVVEFLCGVPFDVVWPLASACASRRLSYAYLHGTALFRGQSKVRSLWLGADFDSNDY